MSLKVLSCFLQLPSFPLWKAERWLVTPYLHTRLCLQNEEMDTFPGRRGYVFPKMEGRKVSTAWPPSSPALTLAPGRVKNSPPTLQMHYVLSIPVPLDRIFSRPLTLFPFSTEKIPNSAKIKVIYCGFIL